MVDILQNGCQMMWIHITSKYLYPERNSGKILMAAVRNSCESCERRPIFFIGVPPISKMIDNANRPVEHRSHFGSRYHIWSMRLARPFCFKLPLATISKMIGNANRHFEHRSHFGSRYHIWSMRLARPFCFWCPLSFMFQPCGYTHPGSQRLRRRWKKSHCISRNIFDSNARA